MKRFLGFLVKEFYHIFRDYRTMVILFGMPVIQILLFGFAIRNEIKDTKIAILDYSRDNVTQEISNKILSSGYFILSDNLFNEKELEEEFKKGTIKEIIIFEQNFSENLYKTGKANIQLILDASEANLANMVMGYTNSILKEYQKEISGKYSSPPSITTEVKMRYNPELKSVYMFVPGIMAIILMLVSALMTSISITREKELGTMEILLVSPLNPLMIIIGKVIPYLILGIINAVIILLISANVFNVPVSGSNILLLAETVLFVITALSLGILISTLVNDQQTAMMISLAGLMLPTVMLSGYVFPIENMPVVLQWLSHILPAKWYVIIVKSIMLKGSGFGYIWKETLILAGMTIFLILLSIKKFKIRLF